MKQNIKEFIERAEEYKLGSPLSDIYIISTDKLYRGFWGENGYNGIIIVGYYKDKYYLVNKDYECDVINFRQIDKSVIALDIPHDINAIHMWFSPYLICFKELLSSMTPCILGRANYDRQNTN